MEPSVINKICAYPDIVAWIITAAFSNVFVFGIYPYSSYLAIIEIIEIFIPLTLLSYFIGMFTIWPAVRKKCSSVNGSPLRVGDRVKVLKGEHKGKSTIVYEILSGQGGWDMARIDLGSDSKNTFKDSREQYELFKYSGLT